MNVDRTTKTLLGAIALGIWTLIVMLAMSSRASTAAGPEGAAGPPALVMGERGWLYVADNGRIYKFSDGLGRPHAMGEFGPNVELKK